MTMRLLSCLTLCLLLSACAFFDQSATPTPAAPGLTPTRANFTQVEAGGVTLGISAPDGWQVIPNDDGILLAEYANFQDAEAPHGILVYLFVPPPIEIPVTDQPANENHAWALLNTIAHMPDYVGNAAVSATQPFVWGEHHAAYYLLTDAYGNHTMVVAVMHADQMIVANISTPGADAHRIRTVLPILLSDLTIDGERLDGRALDALPDPLPFPEALPDLDYAGSNVGDEPTAEMTADRGG